MSAALPEPGSLIVREPLLERLDQAQAGHVVLVCGPAGSGKTALLRTWSARLAAGGDEPAVLVLDDLHELSCARELDELDRFLAELPPTVGAVLATREEPSLPALHRLRLEGRLTELRAADLRFSLDEARALLAAFDVALPEDTLAALHERTEGWAAGLALTAVGGEAATAAYLTTEVLDRQPPAVRDLLLRTAVLEQVSGPLADRLTGGSGAEATLQRLEDAGAFVTSVDAGRSWFRYHGLLAGVLRAELERTAPATVPFLHRTAAQWHEVHGDHVESVRHAQAAGDWAQATRVLAGHELGLVLDGRRAVLRALVAGFPREIVDADPELLLARAMSRAFDGLLGEAVAAAGLAARSADAVPADRRASFELRLAGVRLLLARCAGDVAAAMDDLQGVEEALAGTEDPHTVRELELSHDVRAAALLNLGVAELWSMRPLEAHEHLEQALDLARRGDRPYLAVGCLGHLTMADTLCGLPVADALRRAEQAIALAERHGWTEDPVAAPAFASGAHLLVRQGRFAEAEVWLDRAEQALGAAEPAIELVVYCTRGLLRLGQGRPAEAMTAFAAARGAQGTLAGEHPLASELRSRLLQAHVLGGDAAAGHAALAAMSDRERDRAGMRVAAATAHLADGDPRAAVDVLAPVLDGGVATLHRPWAELEAVVLDAAARDRLGDRHGAERSVARALDLAERDRMILPFALAPVGELVERHARNRAAHASLVAAISELLDGSASAPSEPVLPGGELSAAELRVLRYLSGTLSAREIAGELCLSANTVKTHVRNIYTKLAARSRPQAIVRARELGLIGPGARTR